jgi:hypothetical protein
MPSVATLHPATVISNDDPMEKARLQVELPALGMPPQWAVPCLPPIAKRDFVLPQAGDTVWVMFEAGDPNRPVWLGVLPSL